MIRITLPLCIIIMTCTPYYISDDDIPNEVKIISEDHPLYDGKRVRFIGYNSDYRSSSISGRRQYMWEELAEKNGRVIGEFELPNGRYYIVEMDDLKLIKIPSSIFLDVIIFPEESEYKF